MESKKFLIKSFINTFVFSKNNFMQSERTNKQNYCVLHFDILLS